MKNLISVIVPVYKVEQYLDDCINSLVKQSYVNLEIILVDDGSPDNCPRKCDEWAQKDSRIKVIHKKNGGLSSARNAGLNIAKGNYYAFVDSDDWIEHTMYADMVKILKAYNVDFVAGKINCYIEEKDKFVPFMEKSDRYIIKQNKLFSKEEYRKLIISNKIESAVWNKLYRKEYIDNLRFKEGRLYEDYLFSYYATKRMKAMYYLATPYYNYRIRENSICTSMEKINDWDLNFEELYNDIIANKDYKILDELYIFEMRHYLSLLKKEGLKNSNLYLHKIFNIDISLNKLPLNLKIKYLIAIGYNIINKIKKLTH